MTATLLLPATASAAGGGSAAVQDCQDGKIDGTYTAAEYRDALKAIPTDVDEYTDCRDVLRGAQLRAAARPTGRGGSAVAAAPPAGAQAAAAPGAPEAATSSAPAPSTGTAQAPSFGAVASGEGGVVASTPDAPSVPASQAPGTAPPPRIPGLPADTAIVGGSEQGTSPVPVATASRVTEQVPSTLALVLVLAATALLLVRLLRVRRAAS